LVAPVSFTGGIVLLLLTGTALNVSSMMGFILLVGLALRRAHPGPGRPRSPGGSDLVLTRRAPDV